MTQHSDPPSQPSSPPAYDTQSASAQLPPQTRLDRILSYVPRVLSSHAHIIFLGCLGVYLVLLPLFGVNVSSKAELIGGNYTNVTSDLGACIAAGLTVHLVKRAHRRSDQLEEVVDALHRRHEALESALHTTLEAANRAESAARSLQ